jgi:hypothetical protein
MTATKGSLAIPHKTLNVSLARAQLTQLLRRLRVAPKIYLIKQSGKPAGALVNVDWLESICAQSRGKQKFTIFGQAAATKSWEQSLTQWRQTLTTRTLSRLASKGR